MQHIVLTFYISTAGIIIEVITIADMLIFDSNKKNTYIDFQIILSS
jgi:hypothetical protein